MLYSGTKNEILCIEFKFKKAKTIPIIYWSSEIKIE